MKPTVKIASLLMAVLMLFSVFASGCSLSREWSYKTDEDELAFGVYVTAMQEAYTEAQNYASSLEDYSADDDSWLDLEITDSEGNKAVAKDWIVDNADRKCREFMVLEPALKELGATIDEAALDQSKETYATAWYTQYKDVLEKLGASMESFCYYMSRYSTLREQLFNALYGKGGTQEVKTEEIEKYLVENYARYAVLPVQLYEASTDEAGQSTNAALSADDQKKITDAVDGIAKKINEEKDAAKAAEQVKTLTDQYIAENDDLQENALQNLTLPKENSGITDEDLSKALQGLEEGKAASIKIGKDGEDQSYLLLFRYDADSLKKNYETDGVTLDTVLKKMKAKDFDAYLKDKTDKANIQKSSSVDRISPKDFFVKKTSQTSLVTG